MLFSLFAKYRHGTGLFRADTMILPSNARIAGMEEDLELHGQRYQWLLNIFYISYIVFEFQALMWKILPPNIWAAFVVFGWGIAATLQSTTKVWATEMVCRWFLGKAWLGNAGGDHRVE